MMSPTTTTQKPTGKKLACSDLIAEKLAATLKDIKQALRSEKKTDEYRQNVLAVSQTETYKVELSWGGPADGFLFEVDPETRQLQSATYYYQDWFDNATLPITDPKDLDLLEQIFGYFWNF